MKPTILNRSATGEFVHPADGFYNIEAAGFHPATDATGEKIVQVIDAKAITSITNRFNVAAAAGKLRHGGEMLIDHEHFRHENDQESRAYGWAQELAARPDGVYARNRWTATGKPAVDGGDYRFFSTEYDGPVFEQVPLTEIPADIRNKFPGRKFLRPLELTGLSLTNQNNNRGQKPITNRQVAGGATTFAASREAADSTATNNIKNKKMKTVCTLLGLSAEADESSVHAAVTALKNRVTELEPLGTENTTLKNRITEIDAEQVDNLLALHGVKDAKVINRLKPVLTVLKNREERVAALLDFGFKPETAKPAGRVLNRETGKPEAAAGTQAEAVTTEVLNAEVRKIMNRDSVKFEPAYNTLRREKPELFQPAESAN